MEKRETSLCFLSHSITFLVLERFLGSEILHRGIINKEHKEGILAPLGRELG